MTPHEEQELMRALAGGEASRNRCFRRFEEPARRRVLHASRCIRGLLEDLRRDGSEAGVAWSHTPPGLTVTVRQPRIRYRRTTFLTPLQARFLLEETDAVRHLPDLPPPPDATP